MTLVRTISSDMDRKTFHCGRRVFYNAPMNNTLTFVLLLSLAFPLYATTPQAHSITLDDEAALDIEVYPAKGKHLILWLPSEEGLSPRQTTTATAMAELGLEVWIPDLHGAWFIPVGRYSLNNVDPSVIQQLLETALASKKTVYVMASDRTNALALRGIRRYQQSGEPTHQLGGLLGFNPNLFIRTPRSGETARLLSIATASNTPIYLLQPKNSSSYWRTAELVAALSVGGSPVFIQTLYEVGEHFYLRAQFSPQEAQMSQHLPGMLVKAITQLETSGGVPGNPAPIRQEEKVTSANPDADQFLRSYPIGHRAPALHLPAVRTGEKIDLMDLAGKVVIVNFWATWCPHCVEEMPSLQHLYTTRRSEGLEVLAVNVGESPEAIRAFMADHSITFPVLSDLNGDALKAWEVHGFPTNLMLDRHQHIRYAIFGASDWTDFEMTTALQTLLDEG